MWEPYIDGLRKAMSTRPNQEDLNLHALISRFLNLYENQLCVSSVDEALAVISGNLIFFQPSHLRFITLLGLENLLDSNALERRLRGALLSRDWALLLRYYIIIKCEGKRCGCFVK